MSAVITETPPVSPSMPSIRVKAVDTITIQATVATSETGDAALFVVGAGVAPRDEVEAALERLDASKVVGVVLNRCASSEVPYAGAYGYGKG